MSRRRLLPIKGGVSQVLQREVALSRTCWAASSVCVMELSAAVRHFAGISA